MTRFARAQGSKASNERTPEDATPWYLMKQQLIEDKHKKETYNRDNLVSSHFMKRTADKRSFTNQDTKQWEDFDVKESTSSKENNTKNDYKQDLRSPKGSNTKNDKQDVRRDLKKIKKEKVVDNSCCNVDKGKVIVKGNKFTVSLKNNEVSSVGVNSSHSNWNNNINYNQQKKIVKSFKDETPKDENLDKFNLDVSGKNKKLKRKDLKLTDNTIENKQNVSENNQKLFKKRKGFVPFDNSVESTENGKFNDRNNKANKEIGIKNSNVNISRNNYSGSHKNSKMKNGFPSGTIFNSWQNSSISVGGKIVKIADFHGFAVKKEDAQRLHKLRKDLLLKGVPRKEVEVALKAERRRAEKALAREKKAVCFKCRKFGHNMSECPECDDPSGVCFKCGSTEHSGRDCRVVQNDSFKYAHCFICQEQGHIARQCPDNPRGLYPKGGACKVCGDVTHLKKDCPQLIDEKETNTLTVGTVKSNCVEVLDEDLNDSKEKVWNNSRKTNLVKF